MREFGPKCNIDSQPVSSALIIALSVRLDKPTQEANHGDVLRQTPDVEARSDIVYVILIGRWIACEEL